MIYEDRIPRFLTTFMNELRARDITTIFTSEMPDLFSDRIYLPIERMAGLVDNVIFVRYVELRSQLYRLLSIMKMRDSAYDTTIREFKIGSNGITVASTFKSAEAILTGVARPLPTTISKTNHELPLRYWKEIKTGETLHPETRLDCQPCLPTTLKPGLPSDQPTLSNRLGITF